MARLVSSSPSHAESRQVHICRCRGVSTETIRSVAALWARSRSSRLSHRAMVGAGNLIRLLFGFQYELAVIIVGVVMRVLLSRHEATTWVQVVKAVFS